MSELSEILEQTLNRELVQIILSNTRDGERASKVKIRPVLIKDRLLFQETLYHGVQVFHSNFERAQIIPRVEDYCSELFRQGEIKTSREDVTILVSKKGRMSIKRRARALQQNINARGVDDAALSLAHNQAKKYILEDGKPTDFLVGLGVQTPDGKVVKAKYDKFRQINRYLEFIEDVLKDLPDDRPIRIIDFGCGKSYLTFAMYYYLSKLQKREVRITGLDLKPEVIAHCNELAEKLHYENLHFEQGDISTYGGEGAVDMVVTLHACDVATDYALQRAIKWGAGVIMAVPCCQHEMNRQIKCDALKPVLKYGVIKERIAALVTDALRADILEQYGYDTQILEFIDMEHTPKNLLIRAVKNKKLRPKGKQGDIGSVKELLQVSPALERLLKE